MDYTSLIKEVDIPELVKALRLCQFGECGCGKCYYKELKGDWCTEDNHPEFFDCDDKLKLDAAAAIEELQAEVKRLEPKRGEWVEREVIQDRMDARIPQWQQARCSVCGKWHTTPYMYCFDDFDYCPNCGAKMTEVRE